MRFTRKRVVRAAAATALVVGGAIGAAIETEASTPGSHAVAVPATGGQSRTVEWDGTIPAGSAHPTSTCNGAGTPSQDAHVIDLSIPPGGYGAVHATFTFSITWAPAATAAMSDEILTVNRPKGGDQGDTESAEVGSSDSSDTTETVIGHDLGAGQYQVLACGYTN
jgi:hypothetical protein